MLEFPDQAEFVFQNLAPRSGNDAVLGVVQFLDRLDTLEKGERAATKDDDNPAIAELTKRGIGPDERARLRRLVAVAHSSPEIVLDAPSEWSFQDQRMRTLTSLYYWYERWVEVARVVVKQRNDAIMLGIAKRRARKDDGTADAADTADAVSGNTSPTKHCHDRRARARDDGRCHRSGRCARRPFVVVFGESLRRRWEVI